MLYVLDFNILNALFTSREYLTGFQKRKKQRKSKALQVKLKKAKAEHKKLKQEVRAQFTVKPLPQLRILRSLDRPTRVSYRIFCLGVAVKLSHASV